VPSLDYEVVAALVPLGDPSLACVQQTLVNARTALVTAPHDHVVASYNLLAAEGKLLPRVLRLATTTYDPTVHYQQVRDA
jgi:outer membrane protein